MQLGEAREEGRGLGQEGGVGGEPVPQASELLIGDDPEADEDLGLDTLPACGRFGQGRRIGDPWSG